ncbi:glycosyl hydrolase [Glycomyces tenuis]|uniref:glycosyl hydrolase n=1 Tax=Glycomyces tenuis TaxID=58116 RepID=UPI0004271A7A|nr:glycosyl hydrolase [Glycomyces tenuis]
MRFRRTLSSALVALVTGALAFSMTSTGAEGQEAPTDAQVFEAEDGALQGVTVGSSASGYSGTGYVEGFDEATDSVTITVPDSPGGLHDLTIHYRAPYGEKQAYLQLNGEGAGSVTFAAIDTFSTVSAGRMLLEEGENTIAIVNNWGWYEIDAISLAPSEPRPPHQVSGIPVDPDATPEARELLADIAANYGENILSGQQDVADVEWVEQNVGKAPAVMGVDMMDYSPSRVERGTVGTDVDAALPWAERGGIVTFTWHWNAPTGLIDEPGKEWWRGFYTDATTFDVAAALADKESEEYQLLLRDIDAISEELLRLQDAGVPVLWRPLHEAEGGWFWWGAKGPEPAKELWRIMYDRMVDHHGLHNLLWVWNSTQTEWYPGNDVVDIISADAYPQAGDFGPISGTYEKLVELVGDEKPVALTENGSIPDPDLLEAYEADWSWFNTWAGDFIRDGVHNPPSHLEHVYNHPRVITLDELDEWRSGSESEAPSAPGALAASDVGSDRATLTWEAAEPGSAEIAGYEVYAGDVGGDPLAVVEAPATTVTLTDLAPGTAYTFRVVAVDAEGRASAPSAPVEVTTEGADPAGACTVDYQVSADWGNGFVAEVAITNEGPALDAWELGFAFPGSQQVSNGWNSDWAQSGNQVTFTDAGWNGTLASNESTTIGFVGSYSGGNPAPEAFTLNGASCAVG